ncbi:exodeoxyribonuclease VII large subunit [Bacillus spongiae]|uniref:Exodeoxyribonuclease 7 large subunit n=1 Tax=Bacillus spongiae TaxID=2683610 RepID=A0ABU8HG43_9BACI
MSHDRYLSVHSLTKYIKRKFDVDPHLSNVHVRGEISNFKQHSSGHMYFTIKDDKARLLSVMFSSQNRQLKFAPENGMNVLVQGDISIYESSGQYQIYIKKMQPDGIGELYLAYEQLKERLEKEGLFEQGRKKALPPFPKVIGVITSPTGAAVRDIITTIKRRYPIGKVVVIPALVQGEQAAPSIVKGIKTANERKEIDVLIVGRGGGSIEELWAFNEEVVVREIVASRIPVISAVGHETDFTIADFVADIRAATPTGAAEIAVPHIDELKERVLQKERRLAQALTIKVKENKVKLENLEKSYVFRNPMRLFQQKMERLDRLNEKLYGEYQRKAVTLRDSLSYLQKRLYMQHPRAQVQQKNEEYKRLNKQLNQNMTSQWKNYSNDFERLLVALDALSPLKILERGYSVVYKENETLVKSKESVAIGDNVTVELADGALDCKVIEVKEKGRR